MKAYTLILLTLLFVAACKKSHTTTPPAPGTTVMPNSQATPLPTLMITYPYTDTFYGALTHDYSYVSYTIDTAARVYVIHTSSKTLRFSAGYFQYTGVLTGDLTITDNNLYGEHLKKDFWEYKLINDSLYYEALDTHGPDYDRWEFAGKMK